MRLIDADYYCINVCMWFAQDCDKKICPIQTAPTIDPESLRPQGMRIEIKTSCFENDEIAKERGYYRKYFFCPSCNTEIGHQTLDRNRVFGQGTILHSNEFPNYCPNCGAKMKGVGENADN